MELYDVVKLKDGQTGTIVEIFEDACEIDVGDSPDTWETITIKKNDIERVMQASEMKIYGKR